MGNPLLGYAHRLLNNQTKAEQALEHEICKLGLRYRTQFLFPGQKAIVDFLLIDKNCVIEVDDPSHEEDAKRAKDIERTKALNTLGLKVIRFTNAQVLSELSFVISQIAKELLRTTSAEADEPQEEYPSTLALPLKGKKPRKRPPYSKRSKRT